MSNKNFLLLILVVQNCLLIPITYGQEKWIPFTKATESKILFTLNASSLEKVIFSVEVPGMFEQTVMAQEKYYQRLRIPEQTKTTTTGFPEIPIIRQLIAIPDCDRIHLTIIPLDSIHFDHYMVCPVPKSIKKYDSEGYRYFEDEFVINDSVYSVNIDFPYTNGKIAESGQIREQRVVRVEIFPIQFNPVAKKLKIYTRIQIKLDFISPKSGIVKDVGPFEKACKSAILNYR